MRRRFSDSQGARHAGLIGEALNKLKRADPDNAARVALAVPMESARQ